MTTTEAQKLLTEAAEKYGTRSQGYYERSMEVLRALWESGFACGTTSAAKAAKTLGQS